MNKGTKIGITLSTLTVAGLVVTTNVSKKLVEQVKREMLRYKLKRGIHNNLKSNGKLLSVADNLSNNELDSINRIVEAFNSGSEKIKSVRKNR